MEPYQRIIGTSLIVGALALGHGHGNPVNAQSSVPIAESRKPAQASQAVSPSEYEQTLRMLRGYAEGGFNLEPQHLVIEGRKVEYLIGREYMSRDVGSVGVLEVRIYDRPIKRWSDVLLLSEGQYPKEPLKNYKTADADGSLLGENNKGNIWLPETMEFFSFGPKGEYLFKKFRRGLQSEGCKNYVARTTKEIIPSEEGENRLCLEGKAWFEPYDYILWPGAKERVKSWGSTEPTSQLLPEGVFTPTGFYEGESYEALRKRREEIVSAADKEFRSMLEYIIRDVRINPKEFKGILTLNNSLTIPPRE